MSGYEQYEDELYRFHLEDHDEHDSYDDHDDHDDHDEHESYDDHDDHDDDHHRDDRENDRFHAEDDENVAIAETVTFAEQVRKTNETVELVKVKTGGHYDSMIKEGIPRAIKWIAARSQPK